MTCRANLPKLHVSHPSPSCLLQKKEKKRKKRKKEREKKKKRRRNRNREKYTQRNRNRENYKEKQKKRKRTTVPTCFPLSISNVMHDLTWTIMPKKFNVMSSFLSTSLLILSFCPLFQKRHKNSALHPAEKTARLIRCPVFFGKVTSSASRNSSQPEQIRTRDLLRVGPMRYHCATPHPNTCWLYFPI